MRKVVTSLSLDQKDEQETVLPAREQAAGVPGSWRLPIQPLRPGLYRVPREFCARSEPPRSGATKNHSSRLRRLIQSEYWNHPGTSMFFGEGGTFKTPIELLELIVFGLEN